MPRVLCVDSLPAVGLLSLQQHLQRGMEASRENLAEGLQTFYSYILCYHVEEISSYLILEPFIVVSEKYLHIGEGSK